MPRSKIRSTVHLTASASAVALASYIALTDDAAFAQDASARPAWAAEATMNADYLANATTAPAPTAGAVPQVATAAVPELAMTPPGRTEYYGDSKPTGDAAFAAEATMNPDYAQQSTASEPATAASTTTEATPAAPEMSPAATVAAELPMTPPGRTEFYGATVPATPPAWAADATMNPDYAAAAAGSTPPATAAPAANSAVVAEPAAASSCSDALNSELSKGKITFGSGSFSVTQSSYRVLDNIAKAAKACSGVTIEVGGHTDNVGSASGNATISDLRAKAIVTYLTRAGVDGAMLRAVGYGDAKPVAPNDTPAGRRANRRIEFVVSQ